MEAYAAVRLAEVLHVARARNASDVHLRAGAPPVLRVDGELEPMSVAAHPEEIDAICEALLDERDRAQLLSAGDVSATYRSEATGSVRVHVYRTAYGTSVAMRLLAMTVPAMDALGLPVAVLQFCSLARGLVIVAGPTGSGKSTTLAAMIDRINGVQSRHILTIEDPIEYEHRSQRSLVTQRQVGRDTPSFAEGVVGALRSDPDVLLIGEMRDAATMHAALTAAETGHLVFASLHTGDAAGTIDRIVSAFAGDVQAQIRIQLAQTLEGIVCTRLLPRSGATGRVCAAEILVATDAIRTLVRDGRTHQIKNAIATGKQHGMQTLESHLAVLVSRREIAADTARRL